MSNGGVFHLVDPGWEEGAGPPSTQEVDYDQLRRQLARSISQVCPRWMAAYKEDILQSALLHLLRTSKMGARPCSLSLLYLRKVAHTATVDEIRRIRRQECLPLEKKGQPEGCPVYCSIPSLERTRDVADAIRGCMERLNEPRRKVVELFLMGHDLTEMERLTGWGAKRVRNLLYRGRARLRGCLSDSGLKPWVRLQHHPPPVRSKEPDMLRLRGVPTARVFIEDDAGRESPLCHPPPCHPGNGRPIHPSRRRAG